MNKSIGTMIMATSLLLGACNPATDVNVRETGDKNLIGKSDIRIKDGRMTPEALWAMGRIGGMNVSPDGKKWCIRWRIIAYRKTRATVRSS